MYYGVAIIWYLFAKVYWQIGNNFISWFTQLLNQVYSLFLLGTYKNVLFYFKKSCFIALNHTLISIFYSIGLWFGWLMILLSLGLK